MFYNFFHLAVHVCSNILLQKLPFLLCIALYKTFHPQHLRISAAYNFIYCRITITFGTIIPIHRIRFIWNYYFSSGVFIICAFRHRRKSLKREMLNLVSKYICEVNIFVVCTVHCIKRQLQNEIYALKCLEEQTFKLVNGSVPSIFSNSMLVVRNCKKKQGMKRLLINAIASTPCFPSGTKESCINTLSHSTSADKNTVIHNSRATQTYLSYSHTFASPSNIGVSGDSSQIQLQKRKLWRTC